MTPIAPVSRKTAAAAGSASVDSPSALQRRAETATHKTRRSDAGPANASTKAQPIPALRNRCIPAVSGQPPRKNHKKLGSANAVDAMTAG
jgi:hypothetical protein